VRPPDEATVTIEASHVVRADQMLSASVVVTTYQRPERLADCLDALRAQSRPPDEVIVVVHVSDAPSARLVRQRADGWPELRWVQIARPGTVAAYNRGLAVATGAIVAYVDDDAVAGVDWLARIVETFAQDDRIAGVGGRDVIVENERVLDRRERSGTGAREPAVGRVQWFGRMLGNHHLGSGPPRDVDVLKGVNMSFRRSALAGLGFDERLRGRGAQMHSELSICLPLKRRDLRLVYDPSIAVEHFAAPRAFGDQRADIDPEAVFATAHNEALQILDYFGPGQRLLYAAWGLVVGSTEAPGIAVLVRDLLTRRLSARARFAASQRGRLAAWGTRREPRTDTLGHRAASPRVLHRPELGWWRQRHVFGALHMRPAIAQHSDAEAALLMRYGARARTIVELGVAEGGSAAELRSVMSPDGDLCLVDPYTSGRLGMSMMLIVARRTVRRVRGGRVSWLRMRSDQAIHGWNRPIDFLFIDADHSYERAAGDWRLWTPFVTRGGYVALHDSVVFPAGWTDERSGPVRLLGEILDRQPEWSVVGQADSLTVLRRDGDGDAGERASGSHSSAPTGSAGQRPLRVLRVADVPNVPTAGMSGYMLSSGREMERRGHHVAYWFRDQLAPAIANPGLRRLLVPWLIIAKVTAGALRRERLDVVEIHEPLAGAYGLVARALGSRLPACGVLSFGVNERMWEAEHAHLRVYGRRPSVRSRILVPLTLLSQARVGFRTAQAVLVPSTADREYVIGRMRVPAERVSCSYTGVSEHLFSVEKTAHRDVRLLFLGSWIERKGTLELVAAWRRLAAERSTVRLTLAGVGDADCARAELADLPRVELIPDVARHELPALLAGHDVFVLPSWFEGMPLAMLEAAAAGLACVVCSLCGNLDVFRPEDPQSDGAILIPPNDPDALYRALIRLVDDGELRAALAVNARARARSFTWGATAEQALAAYSAAIERRDGALAPTHRPQGSPDGHSPQPQL
jgi:glycosyltransferase involved in cell wall biosynthesis/GT2 family glycosyltransferase/predicted O-methyltransferase YrrM